MKLLIVASKGMPILKTFKTYKQWSLWKIGCAYMTKLVKIVLKSKGDRLKDGYKFMKSKNKVTIE